MLFSWINSVRIWLGVGYGAARVILTCLLDGSVRVGFRASAEGRLGCSWRGQLHSWDTVCWVRSHTQQSQTNWTRAREETEMLRDSDLAFLGYILKPAQLKVLLVPHWGSSQCIYIHTLIYYAVISPSWKLWGQFISVLEHPDKFNMLNVFQLAQLHIPHRQTISMRSIYNWNHLGAFHRIHDTLLAYSFCCCCSLKVIALIEIKSKLLF